ncbi:MAG TPA: class I SAM-dependent methyltransferase [Streptosporangiaceae bacterium]
MASEPRSWATDRPVTSPFALPAGSRGRLAGWFMLLTNRQRDLLPVLDVRPGDEVLEIGPGPGGLIRVLSRRTGARLIRGVDPSPEMVAHATQVNRAAVRSGQVRLSVGSAERTGLPDHSVDHVVAVNNVAIWPDLEAGLRELHRVLRPDGSVVIAWHGGSAPSRLTRTLQLPAGQLARIRAALASRFTGVSQQQLPDLEVFKAYR